MAQLLLIDGNSIMNRAFYGVKSTAMLTTRDGTPTNAVYGFIQILNRWLDDLRPTSVAVAFDLPAPTFRHLMFDDYKGTRKGMPDELAAQMPIVKDVLRAMRIPVVEQAGLEADDLIGILSADAERDGTDVSILTGDRDSLQLVSERVTVHIPSTGKGGTETNTYTPAAVFEKYGVEPTRLIEVKGLMGDPSDNIPGVPSVGEKTALDLIRRYGTIEEVYAHLDEIGKPKLVQNLSENREMAMLSRTLGTIDRTQDIGVPAAALAWTGVDAAELATLFRQLEFTTLIRKMGLDAVRTAPNAASEPAPAPVVVAEPRVCERILTIQDLERIPSGIAHLVVMPSGYDVQSGTIESLILSDLERCWHLETGAEGGPDAAAVAAALERLMNGAEKITVHGMKELARLMLEQGREMPLKAFDTILAEYLLDPAETRYDIARIAAIHVGADLQASPDALDGGMSRDLQAASLLPAIRTRQEALLDEHGQTPLFESIEKPLAVVLADMERLGFRVDPERLAVYDAALGRRIAELEQAIHFLAGGAFNIQSTKQLGSVLFEQLGLRAVKKTKTGYSTDADVLEELKDDHEIVPAIMEYRQLTKLKSTYSEGLMKVISPRTGRIHSRFNQTVAVTGRISSTEPNLQNIPIRTEMGRQIRKVFIPEPGCMFIDADYSQIELRVLAHMTGDETLRQAFLDGTDIHTLTASQVFGVQKSEVTGEMRRRAKAVNFGIIYGISDFGLAQDIGTSRKEAARYIEGYLDTYPGVRAYMTSVVEEAERNGYVETVFHRRRLLPELKSKNFQIRAFGKRVALNAPIQGTAADIIKIAMIEVRNRLQTAGLKARLVLQVHDELVVEAPEDEVERASAIVREAMEKAVDLSVPLSVDLSVGRDWYEAK